MESKRNRKIPSNTRALVANLNDYNSESDSDFCPEDHMDSDSQASTMDDDEDGPQFCNSDGGSVAAAATVDGSSKSGPISSTKEPEVAICAVCLQDAEHQSEAVLECSGCCITVHRTCYAGGSLPLSGAAWMCEACSAGVSAPTCELCPNTAGVFKKTSTNKWVHLACALYVPRVVINDACVSLSEVPSTKWSGKLCTLCSDINRAKTGVCIRCDAGMCNEHFHATCAQAAGLLVEPESDGSADPYFGHCRKHSEKEAMLQKQQNFVKLCKNMQEKLREKAKQEADGTTQLVKRTMFIESKEHPQPKKQKIDCSRNKKNGTEITEPGKRPHLKSVNNFNSLKAKAADLVKSVQMQNCAICQLPNEQTLLVECGICKRNYHVNCLDPPLNRVPQKSKWWTWQCDLCDNAEKDEISVENTRVRKLRPRK